MNPFETRLLGNTGIKIPLLGFGGAPLGELFEIVEHKQAVETLDEAYASGIRYYDTAPWYGHGLSEHRLGNLLYQKNRHEFILSTKVGRVYRPFKDDPVLFDGSPWVGGLPFEWNFDYSAAGFERSFLDSTLRLGLNRIDLLVIHDLDRSYHGKSVSKKLKELESGMEWLKKMKKSEVIQGFGAGINDMEMIPLFLEHFELDFFLVAMPYTLLNQEPLEEIFPECEKHGIGIIIGSPYASGILATGSCEESKYGYAAVSEEIRNKVQSIEKICEAHRIPIKAAALQFPLAHPLVSSVIPGSLSTAQVLDNIEMLKFPIPPEFWFELKQTGLLHPDAPVK
ncbi:MAG: aldo/keto reductase [SAR324 cluster bacterium]|jgi:D-threo-aldose 1-dehydrogenase|nr:aldo/keto reductase [SAR324 cluster bacterium]